MGSELLQRLHRACLDEGLLFAGRGLMCMSTVMDDEVVERSAEAFTRALDRVAQGSLEVV